MSFGFRRHPVLDIGRLQSGKFPVAFQDQLVAISVLTGADVPVTTGDVDLLCGLDGDNWTTVSDLQRDADADRIDMLVRAGLVVTDGSDPCATRKRQDNELVAAQAWDDAAASYHYSSKWRGVDVWKDNDWRSEETTVIAKRRVRKYGMPPACFHKNDTVARVHDLPLAPLEGHLGDLLKRRKTVREYDVTRPLSLTDLSRVLYATFGCHAYAELAEDIVILKKTSPSGGAAHAIEVYPLVIDVDGPDPGLYHYDVERHALVEVRKLSVEEARARAHLFAAGQEYFASAPVMLILTARFYRSFWKYRAHAKAYRALLMDAAHLSQTLYLVCAELGLGAYVTAAINESDIDEALGLRGFDEGAIAVTGCGYEDISSQRLQPDFKEYLPRSTTIPSAK